MEIPVITPRALVDLAIHGKPIALIDVRTPGEFREMHIAFAHNIQNVYSNLLYTFFIFKA